MDLGRVSPGNRQAYGVGARRQQQRTVPPRLVALEHDPPRRGID